SYTYDDAGNVLSIIDIAAYNGPPPTPPATQTQSFSYDALHRLSPAQASGATGYGGYSQKNYGYNAIGNLTHFESTTQNQYYQNGAHKHAVTHVGGTTAGYQKYWYDANGNATRRINGSQDVTLTYDAENRLTAMSGGVTASYVYDGDGNRVKETISGVTRVFVGNTYEIDNGTVKKYYYAGATRVAMRTGASTINYLLGDHLGSTALTLNSAGNRTTELRYYPYGAVRYNPGSQVTTYRFTGQRWDSGTALYFYQSRWYDPAVGRFLSADTIVPGAENPQSLNRHSYAANNPVRYTDPSGHWFETALDIAFLAYDIYDIKTNGLNWTNGLSLVADGVTTILPVIAGGGVLVRALMHGDDALKAVAHADDAVQAMSHVDDVTDAVKRLDDLPDDEILYQFSRRPDPDTGAFRGFPDTLRTKQGETGMSCQIASLCGHDSVQGFKQQFPNRKEGPGAGDWVRETTVGDVKQWGGWADPDYLKDTKLPFGHATIYSSGGKWGKPFDRIWRNGRPIAE
ncbi:MAG: RHS repeat-associated core domain-containing protein, partial [Anaerolineae bacterium]